MKSAGNGLNLTEATHVVMVEPMINNGNDDGDDSEDEDEDRDYVKINGDSTGLLHTDSLNHIHNQSQSQSQSQSQRFD